MTKDEHAPVLWLDEEKKIIYWHNTDDICDYHGFKRPTPLYTAPMRSSVMDIKQGQTALAQAMTDEVLAVVYRYHEAVPMVLALGVLDIVKQQIIQDHTEVEEDE